MKKRTLILCFSILLSISLGSAQQGRNNKPQDPATDQGDGSSGAQSCDAGGVGATTCTLTIETEVAGVSTSETATVTCGTGYYACCNYNNFGTHMTAKCYANPQP